MMDAHNGPPHTLRAEVAALAGLSPDALGALLVQATDVAVILDRDGVVRDLAVGDGDTPRDAFEGWVGRSFRDTVTVESRPKVDRMLVAGGAERGGPVHLNHPRPGADDLPVRYSAALLSADRVLAMGRDLSPIASAQRRVLAAQRNAEREFGRLRTAEARYRQYFRVADEPVLFVAANDRIAEANAAAEASWSALNRLEGRRMSEVVEPAERDALAEALAGARAAGGVRVLPVAAGRLVLAPLRHEPGALVVRLSEMAARPQSALARLGRVVEAMPEGFVVTDGAFTIKAANGAFIAMTEAPSVERVLGSPLDDWLGRPGVDVAVIRSALAETGTLRAFSTVVQGELGQTEDVEVSAARVPDGEGEIVGLSIRRVPQPDPIRVPRSAQQLTELVGRVPVKEIVRETTDTIERMCIETALELSGDNRASAAELLGLSRQSLYVKMRRYGIADAGEADEA